MPTKKKPKPKCQKKEEKIKSITLGTREASHHPLHVLGSGGHTRFNVSKKNATY